MEALPNLGLIARIGSDYESVDVPHARARGVEVTNTPGVNAEDVADHAVALLLALVRGWWMATACCAPAAGPVPTGGRCGPR